MIVLVPVSCFRVQYEVASGRPFSELERLVLAAVRGGSRDVESLQRTFHVHRRLLIEALVTLTQAGWIAVGAGGNSGFVLTSEGGEAARSERTPSTTAVSARSTSVWMERITGAIVPNYEVRFVTQSDLDKDWGHAVRMRSEVPDNRIDEGLVQHLLPRKQGEWVRWIGPIDMVTKDRHWLPANVDIEAETIVGVPEIWLPRLHGYVLEAARHAAAALDEEARGRTWAIPRQRRARSEIEEAPEPDTLRVPEASWPVNITDEDVLFTPESHESLLMQVLGEADSAILIVSAFASTLKLSYLQPKIEEALRRGVNIDLLWGYAGDGDVEGQNAVDSLKRMAYAARRDDASGVLRFNSSPSGSHAKMLFWDKAQRFNAAIGSYNWLSAVAPDRTCHEPRDVTVTMTDPGPLAALARCAAALYTAGSSERLASTGDRWRRIAGELDFEGVATAPQESNATLRLVLDRDHEGLMREWLQTAQHRLLVTSHRLGPIGQTRLVSAERGLTDRTFRVLYGSQCELNETVRRCEGVVKRSGGDLSYVEGLHAKVLVSDLSVCVSSYNFLSADPFGAARHAREVGIAIDGNEPASWIWRAIVPTDLDPRGGHEETSAL